MRKILVVVFVVLMALIVLNRQRVYVRDPLATVYKGGVKRGGVQVFINYSNDILLEQDGEPGAYQTLVQGWNRMPGTPVVLRCVHWMLCLADGEHATTLPMEWSGRGKYDPRVVMSNREVSFVDGDGAAVRVELR